MIRPMHRRPQAEWMDDPAADPAELETSLRFIEGVNRWLGYTRSTVRRVGEVCSPTDVVLDVATGAADVPQALLLAGHCTGCIGLDFHGSTMDVARGRAAGESRVRLVQGDALRLPLADGSVDGAMTSMFLHHLDQPGVVQVLSEMRRVSNGWLLAADLERSRRALFWIWVMTRLSGPMVRHDAIASVQQAWTPEELGNFARVAGWMDVKVHRHFGHRMVVTGRSG